MWKLFLTFIVASATQASVQDEIDALVQANQHLMQQIKEIRASLNGRLSDDLQVLARRTEWNREAIAKVATLSQGELLALLAKVSMQSQELGEVKHVVEQVLPEVDRKMETQIVQENQKIDAAASASQEAQTNGAQQMAKLREVAEWLQTEFSREDVQLKGMIEETKSEADGVAQTMQHLLKEEDARLEGQIDESRRKIANVTQMVRKSLPQERLDFQQQLGDMSRKLEAVALAFEDVRRRNQDELQLQSNQLMLLQNRLDKENGRYESVNEALDGVVFAQWVNFLVIISSVIVGTIGFWAFRWYSEAACRTAVSTPTHAPLYQPLLAASARAESEISFSVVTPHAMHTQAHQFLPKSTFSSTEGTVEAEALRPKALVRSAVGTPLEVQSVTFRHLSDCDIVELSLGEALPSATVVASHLVMILGEPGPTNKVVAASELRVGDRIALSGAEVEVSGICQRSISHVNIIEVEFSPDEPVGTLLDVVEQFNLRADEPQFNFHMV